MNALQQNLESNQHETVEEPPMAEPHKEIFTVKIISDSSHKKFSAPLDMLVKVLENIFNYALGFFYDDNCQNIAQRVCLFCPGRASAR